MTRKDFFFKELEERFEELGFKYLKSKNHLVRKSDGNEFIIGFNIWPMFAQVEVHYRMILKDVESFKKSAWGKLYDKYESVGVNKNRLTSDPSKGMYWTDTESNILKAAESELHFYERVTEEWFQSHTNIAYLDNKLNTEPASELYLAHNEIHTSFLAIIVAKLNQNPELDKLKTIYRSVVEKRNSNFLIEYDLLVDKIKKS
ncbi:MAG: hypothetical protein JXR03_21165 [Cyclobacteriaceae bacterium]